MYKIVQLDWLYAAGKLAYSAPNKARCFSGFIISCLVGFWETYTNFHLLPDWNLRNWKILQVCWIDTRRELQSIISLGKAFDRWKAAPFYCAWYFYDERSVIFIVHWNVLSDMNHCTSISCPQAARSLGFLCGKFLKAMQTVSQYSLRWSFLYSHWFIFRLSV